MSEATSATALSVAYLGPEGSFSQLVARQRFPGSTLVPFRTVPEVFDYLEENQGGKAIVPIENSSGGLIIQTVDGIIEHASTLFIEEELSLNVKLALMGHAGQPIETIYSHFAPLSHCEPYLRERYPEAKAIPCTSTSASAEAAKVDPRAATIGLVDQAKMYGLEVLEYPLCADVANVTQFFLMGHERRPVGEGEKTSLVVALPNHPGSLYSFLKPFAEAGVNLTRIESRPMMGQPNTYRFLVELHGTEKEPQVQQAFAGARSVSTHFANVGSYPVVPRYES